jgi:hypothetical protein
MINIDFIQFSLRARLMRDPGTRRNRRISMSLLLFVEGFSSFFGFIGGIPLIADPTGALLGFPLGGTKALSSLPVSIHDFLLPGLWLFFVYGVGFAVATYLLWSSRPRAWSVCFILCMVWLGRITFEIIYFGLNPLIWAWYSPQVGALVLLLWPSVRSSASASS